MHGLEESYLSKRLGAQCATEKDPRTRLYITPTRIVWKTQDSKCIVENSEALLHARHRQISLSWEDLCTMRNDGGNAAILLDFGQEIHGGLDFSVRQIVGAKEARLRIRFGESVSEAMSELLGDRPSTNDHSRRDITVTVQKLSMNPVGETGFRFVRIDLLTPNVSVSFKTVKAAMIVRDIPYLGSFVSSDPLLNKIWDVGAYTVHLNMQQYIWDGIKRDRMVWVGDLHPEILTIQTVFGDHPIIRDSLDYAVHETKPGTWMNNIPSYSMWWVIVQHDYYRQYGNKAYLEAQLPYLKQVCQMLSNHIGEDGMDTTPENRFVDWQTKGNLLATNLGLQALHILAVKCAMYIFRLFDDEDMVAQCNRDYEMLCGYPVGISEAKQANALAVWAGLLDAKTVNERSLKHNGSAGVSAFLGYYILDAMAKAGNMSGGLEIVRSYWGGMLQLGATTFWEDFDIEWLKNGAPIDRFPDAGEIDVHAEYGRHCYQSYRHSLCHGWSSGPSSWLSKYVLGVEVIEPGCKKVLIKPNLCDLQWVRGTYPTPFGVIEISHTRKKNGGVETTVNAPAEIEVSIEK